MKDTKARMVSMKLSGYLKVLGVFLKEKKKVVSKRLSQEGSGIICDTKNKQSTVTLYKCPVK